jgi:LemA protein
MAADPHGTPGETMAYVFVLLPALAVAWAIWTFNKLVRLRNQTRTAWADIDVQLTRRHDLVPMLVESVKAYAGHEKALLENVAALRAQAMTLKSPQQLGQVESQLEQGLGRLFMLTEAYPDLKANQNFAQLQTELVEVEDHLQYARRFYNGAVRDLNDGIQKFPDSLIANSFGFAAAEFFRAGDDARAAPKVEGIA